MQPSQSPKPVAPIRSADTYSPRHSAVTTETKGVISRCQVGPSQAVIVVPDRVDTATLWAPPRSAISHLLWRCIACRSHRPDIPLTPCVGFELIRAQPATMCGTTIKTYGSAPADAPNGSWPLMKANNLKEGEPAAPTTTTDPGARRVEPPLSFEGCLHAAGFQRPPDPLVGSLGLPQQLFGLRLGSEAYRWRKHQRGGQEWSEQGRARRHSEVKAGANPVRRK